MGKISIMLPDSLKIQAQNLATKKGVSLGELIRESLQQRINQSKILKESDSFFDDKKFCTKKVPKDLSEKHDEYLD